MGGNGGDGGGEGSDGGIGDDDDADDDDGGGGVVVAAQEGLQSTQAMIFSRFVKAFRVLAFLEGRPPRRPKRQPKRRLKEAPGRPKIAPICPRTPPRRS